MRIITALWFRNLKTFVRNRIQLVFTMVMPFFFLYVFSAIFESDHIDDPVNYMLAGIVITNVFQTSLSIASSTITDIVSGFMKEVLVSPARRIRIALGQLLSATTVATLQSVLVLCIGAFIGLKFTSLVTPFAAVAVMILVGFVFSSLGLLLAALVKNAQTFQIMETAITMPLTFLCGAYVPLNLLPSALQSVAYLNPMTYTTAFFRAVLLEKMSLTTEELVLEQLAFPMGNFVITPWLSMFIVILFGIVFLLAATFVFSKVDFSKINRTRLSDSDIWS